jgi:hypothetical protein
MVGIAMATPKVKKKKAAKKTQVTASRKAAKKAKAAPARRPTKGKAASARKVTTKRAAARLPVAARKPPSTKKTRAAGVKFVKAAAKPSVARSQPIQRRDHAGHIDPKYAAELLGMSEPHEKDPRAFLGQARSSDDLVEELGEEFVQEVTSAEYKAEDVLNEEIAEEVGGPFVETDAATEFAPGTDASNPESATREPVPST